MRQLQHDAMLFNGAGPSRMGNDVPNQHCPEIADLRNFISGSVSEFHADSIGLHIRSCESCLKLLDELDRAENQRLRQTGNGPSRLFVDEPACDALPKKILDMESSRLVSEDVTAPDLGYSSSESFATVGSARGLEITTDGQLGDYLLMEKIGRGGMGVVWKATQLSTRREVAVKVLANFGADELEAQARFEREIELAASLEQVQQDLDEMASLEGTLDDIENAKADLCEECAGGG